MLEMCREGFRVRLAEDDLRQIEFLTTVEHLVINEAHLYYSFFCGSAHPDFAAEFGPAEGRRPPAPTNSGAAS